jgi:hypothetical protein
MIHARANANIGCRQGAGSHVVMMQRAVSQMLASG